MRLGARSFGPRHLLWEGKRVRLTHEVEEFGLPALSHGTVTRIFLGDDTKVFVAPDAVPAARLLFLGFEVPEELEPDELTTANADAALITLPVG